MIIRTNILFRGVNDTAEKKIKKLNYENLSKIEAKFNKAFAGLHQEPKWDCLKREKNGGEKSRDNILLQ